MAFTKPNLQRSWAGSASPADVVDPGTPKYDTGWISEIPTYQNFNWLQQTFTDGLGYFDEQGIGFWDSTVTYNQHAYVKGSDGTLYRSKGNGNLNNDPVGVLTFWEPISAARLLNTSGVDGSTISDALNTLNTGVAAPVAGYVGFRNIYLPNESLPEVNVAGIVKGTNFTIGRSGSGSTFIYTALDALPNNCQAIQVKVRHSLYSSAPGASPPGDTRIETFSVWNFDDPTPTQTDFVSYLAPTWGAVNAEVNDSNTLTFWVPVTVANNFTVRMRLDENTVNWAGTRILTFQLIGFGV